MKKRMACRFNWLALICLLSANRASADQNRWWPTQVMPSSIVRLEIGDLPAPRASSEMTAESVMGLAAQAVNEGRGHEMVWLGTDNIDIEDWLKRLSNNHPGVTVRGTVSLWELIDLCSKSGIVKGYILYRNDRSKGELNEHRPSMDCSVNVATSLAGLMEGIITDESLEPLAQKHGLKMLADVRDKTQAWCFETYKQQFNRHLLFTQDPRKPNSRDLAIAQKALTLYGYADPWTSALKWLEPLSPILGWNGGNEFTTTRAASVYGHFQTASDWTVNLPFLMAGTESIEIPKVKGFDPKRIQWSDRRSAVSFVGSDGDNVDYYEGSFFRGEQGLEFWANPDRGKVPFGWSCCFAHLAQLCPEAIQYAAETQSTNDWFIEFGGGYYYPDFFGVDRKNRWELLTEHARRTWALMKRANTRIIGFNVSRIDSRDAINAYETFARQTDGLLAILVFQYDAYEAGAGKVIWVKDRNGIELPVISARYAIWNHLNERPRAGTPAKIAREIRQSAHNARPGELPRYDWVIVHAWSWFKHAPGADENAEDMAQQPEANIQSRGGHRGYAPAAWCAERLPADIRVMAPEELVWRIRMDHNPAQTKELIRNWRN